MLLIVVSTCSFAQFKQAPLPVAVLKPRKTFLYWSKGALQRTNIETAVLCILILYRSVLIGDNDNVCIRNATCR